MSTFINIISLISDKDFGRNESSFFSSHSLFHNVTNFYFFISALKQGNWKMAGKEEEKCLKFCFEQ